jgi:hypothetical protein
MNAAMPNQINRVVEEKRRAIVSSGAGRACFPGSGMIGIDAEIGKQERLTRRFLTTAPRLSSNEDRIKFSKQSGVVEFQDPPVVRCIVVIEDTEADVGLAVGTPASPRLK